MTVHELVEQLKNLRARHGPNVEVRTYGYLDWEYPEKAEYNPEEKVVELT